MKRKYITALLAVSFTLFMAVPSIAGGIKPMSKEELSSLSDKQAEERVLQLSQRVNELKDGSVPKDQRKQIKNEMREIKKELDFLNDRVTLSVGALIIIILLIILIF